MNHMISLSRADLQKMARGVGLRQVRLISGTVMFAYLISHFLNHALGNISMEALATGVHYHTMFWRFLPVAVLFYSACLVHTALGVWALYQRREFRWKAIEPLQLVLGLSIPMLIVAHVVGIRLGQSLYGHEKLYPQAFYLYFVASQYRIWVMLTVLVVAWVHGCIGLYFWLRMRPFFERASPFLLAAAVLVPTLAMLGIYQGGRTTVSDYQDADWRRQELSTQKLGTEAQGNMLDRVTSGFMIGYIGLLGLVLVARGARALIEHRGGMIALSYGNGRTVRVPKGLSVLEASLRNNVPHASVCGGRARCSTCRIRIIGDHTALPEPSPREAFVLRRLGSADPSIRLACQLRPATDLTFFQLFLPHMMSTHVPGKLPARIGEERYLVSLFVDMRGSTRLAEKRLPFDTVFIVNRFLGAVSQAVLDSGGRPNQFLGDGMLALFGLDTTPKEACRQALRAAALIAANVEKLNQFLSHDLHEPIRFGIGIHGGEVIVGEIGYRDHMVFTALGDAVNVAARLQDMTKSLACEAVISDEVRATAEVAEDALPAQEVAIRGRNEPMTVRTVMSTRVLPALVNNKHTVVA